MSTQHPPQGRPEHEFRTVAPALADSPDHGGAVARSLSPNHSRAVDRRIASNHSRVVDRRLTANHSRAVATSA